MNANAVFFSLCHLYYVVHAQFYNLETDVYCDAMSELGTMAWANGYTINDLAKACVTI